VLGSAHALDNGTRVEAALHRNPTCTCETRVLTV
jgi:hypothetical protein